MMRDELEKAIEEETKEDKLKMYKKRKEFAKLVSKNFVPEVSQRKREEMQRLLELANASAQERIRRIRYQRPKDSILNRSALHAHNHDFNFGNSSAQKLYDSPSSSDNEGNAYSRTVAFGKRQDSGGEHSPSRAYLPAGELEIVKERWSKKKAHKQNKTRSKSSLDSIMNRSNDRNYGDLYESNKSSAKIIEPVDWLMEKRKARLEKGGEYLYKPNLPKKLAKNKLSSFQEIKTKVSEVERMASKLETEALDNYKSNDLYRDNLKVGSMYVDAIKAKAALIDQL